MPTWGDVQIKVEWFRIESRDHATVLDGQSQVEEVNLKEPIRGFPAELVEVIEAGCKAGPGVGISGRVGDDPNAKHVINISSEEE